MRSKASYFSISKPLVMENLRRFWAIPALAFLVYFLSGVFPILMSYNRLNTLAGYIGQSLSNLQPFYMFAHLIFPVMAAVVIFRYLQSVSSVSVMHSMPFTRMKLYNSGFISGLILITVPILLNGIILLLISKPAYSQYYSDSGLQTNAENVFARADILEWIWVSLLIAFVVYAISVFAGIVTGNGLMHFATALWFNFLIPALYAVFIAYFTKFLYGFDTSGDWADIGLMISPYLNVFRGAGAFGAGVTIYYIINFFALYGITALLYRRRKLERATDSLVFGFMEPIICYLIAFLGMTLLGFYFEVLGENSELYLYGGFAAGTVIFFIIGQMIVKKTPRIYNGNSLKSLGIYALIAVLFLLGLNFDVTGFEKRVPNPEKTEGVYFNEYFSGNFKYNQSYMYRSYGGVEEEESFILREPANIKAVTELHRALIDNKERFENIDGVYSSSVSLAYDPEALFSLTRRYNIDYNFYRDSAELAKIYESSEFKDFYAPGNLKYEGLTEIFLSGDVPNRENVTIRNLEDMKEFLACLDADFKASGYKDMVSLKRPYAVANINFKYKNPHSDTPERLLNNTVSYRISDNYKNTLKWLDSNGYRGRFDWNVSEIEYIEIFHYVREEPSGGGPYPQPAAAVYDKATVNVEKLDGLMVTDPDKIRELLDTCETQNINYNDYYYGAVVFKQDVLGQLPDDQYYLDRYGYIPELEEKYALERQSMGYMQLYFNEGNIPDYVLEYFKST